VSLSLSASLSIVFMTNRRRVNYERAEHPVHPLQPVELRLR